MKASSIFSSDEDSTRISLYGTFRFTTEKNMPPFMWCPQLMFSVPRYLVFPAGCSQRNTPDWTPGTEVNLCKTTVECLSENSCYRNRNKVMSKLRSHRPPMSSCALFQVAILCRYRCSVETLANLPGDSTTWLELIA
ncbi:hypothetical protein TNCV_901561 [Trichonephila clavipes]|nr:hypothetical protein TNCV_901561 [Trichonephila clavipes]